MKKLNILISLISIFFALLILVQLLILKTYDNYVIDYHIDGITLIYISISFLISGLLILFDNKFNNKILSNGAILFFLLAGLLIYINKELFNGNHFYIYLSLFCAITIIFSKLNIKKNKT